MKHPLRRKHRRGKRGGKKHAKEIVQVKTPDISALRKRLTAISKGQNNAG